VDEAEIRLAARALRSPHAQEVDLAERPDLRERRGEAEPPGVQVLPQQRFQAGLEERGLAAGGRGDLVLVDVDGQHVVPEVSQADGVGKP
jgi:hypothetical protein